jgi:hypothetical protein
MAPVRLLAGTIVDIPTREEMGAYVGDALAGYQAIIDERDRQRERARGVKWLRLPIMQALPSGGAVTLDEHTAHAEPGPQQGYAWSITRMIVDGLTSGTTPDVVNLYRNGITGQPPLWQFNGNNFGYTWGIGQMILSPGDTLKLASTGTFAATGLIRVTGELFEVPAEMLSKLVVIS